MSLPPTLASLSGTTCIVIDGQALVTALGKPTDKMTFGEYAETLAKRVYNMAEVYDKIDVAIDGYWKDSIKVGTRVKRKHGLQPARRRVESLAIPLPAN